MAAPTSTAAAAGAVRPGLLVGIENPLLDMSVEVDAEFLAR